MLQAIAIRWIAALRSGEYKQGVGRLWRKDLGSDQESYCCLGVLMDIEGTEDEKQEHFFKTEKGQLRSTWGHQSMGLLREGISKRLNLSDTEKDRLMEMNDAGKSFDTIANYIEKELL